MRAAREDHTEIVRILLAAGADIEGKRDDGYTALMNAAFRGSTETVKTLLAAGANVNAVRISACITPTPRAKRSKPRPWC